MGEKGDGKSTAIYKVDMNCQNCAKKVIRAAKDFKGVEDGREGIAGNNNLTVVRKFDPVNLKEGLKSEIKKKVELISPQLKKDKDGRGGKKAEEKSEKKTNKKVELISPQPKKDKVGRGDKKTEEKLEKKREEKKHKEVNIVLKGVQEVTVDAQKGLVTVNGTKSHVIVKGITEAEVDVQKGLVRVKGIMDGDKKKEGGGGDKKKEGGGGGDKKKKI